MSFSNHKAMIDSRKQGYLHTSLEIENNNNEIRLHD